MGDNFWKAMNMERPRQFALKTFCYKFLGDNAPKIYAEYRTISRVFAKIPDLIATEKQALIELLVSKKYEGIPDEVQHYYRRKNIVDMERLINNAENYKLFILAICGISKPEIDEPEQKGFPIDEDEYQDFKADLYNIMQAKFFTLPSQNAIYYLDRFATDFRNDFKSWYVLWENDRDKPIQYQTKRKVYIEAEQPGYINAENSLPGKEEEEEEQQEEKEQ